jgi:Retroviral aspartyl protease
MVPQSRPSRTRIFNFELDGTPTSSSCHHSSNYYAIVTYNKLSEIMTPFHGGNKVRPRINVTMGKKTFNWLFDTGAAIMCMNADSFWESFGHSKPKLLKRSAGCIAANGSRMDSMGIYEIGMTIRGRKFLHPVTIVEDINDNIFGINFMHRHKAQLRFYF